jgi:glucose-1-phosphate cytidylyltransferase
VNDFIVSCGYRGYLTKEFFEEYFLHMQDVTFDMSENKMRFQQKMPSLGKLR